MAWAYSKLVAEAYDFHLPVGYSNGDVEYYTRALAGVRGLILEPATGTGRTLIPLLQAGLRVEGLDHCPDMLALCREHCRARGLEPVLHEGDMATFVRPGAYEAVIVPAGSIRNVDGRERTLQALRSFHTSLVPGGRLVLDVPAPRFSPELGPLRYWRRDPFVWTRQTVKLEYDPVANRTTELQRYEKWENGTLLTAELHIFTLQHWGIEEFGRLLAEAGFAGISVSADYREGNPPGPNSGDWTFQARRP